MDTNPSILSVVGDGYSICDEAMHASCTLIAADPELGQERLFVQPLYNGVPPEQSREKVTDLSRVGRNSASAAEGDGPQPVLNACWRHSVGACPTCCFGRSGQVLISPLVGRTGADAATLTNTLINQQPAPATTTPTATTTTTPVLNTSGLARVSEQRLVHPAPSSRSGHVMVSLPQSQCVIMHGGLHDVCVNDTWKLLPDAGTWQKLDTHTVPFIKFTRPRDADPPGHPTEAHPPTTATRMKSDSALNRLTRASETPLAQPERAFGQCASVCHIPEVPGEELVALYGGIDDDSKLQSSLHLLRPSTACWTPIRTWPELPLCWGATMETMQMPRKGSPGNEEVLIIFGGMTEGNVCPKVTRVVHIENSLKMDELYANAEHFLGKNAIAKEQAQFTIDVQARIENSLWDEAPQAWFDRDARLEDFLTTQRARDKLNRLNAEKLPPGETAQDADLDWRRPVTALAAASREGHAAHRSSAARVVELSKDYVANIRAMLGLPDGANTRPTSAPEDPQTLKVTWRSWLRRRLQPLVGAYAVEEIPNPPGLVGRRRACSTVYRDNFLFLFGGRDDVAFFNDFWVFNSRTRLWAPIRAEMPLLWMQRLFACPDDPNPAAELQAMYEKLKSQLEQKVASTVPHAFQAKNAVRRGLYGSKANSTADGRTGATMAFDASRECLYIYGGFALSQGKYLTFFDLHVYHIREHCWRRVNVLHERPWDAHMDGAEDAVLRVRAVDEVRTCPRFSLSPHERSTALKKLLARSNDNIAVRTTDLPLGDGTWRRDSAEAANLTVLDYVQRHQLVKGQQPPLLARRAEPSPLSAPANRRGVENRGLILVPRRGGRPPSSPPSLFPLPVMLPEPRTMAAMVADPTCPQRFILFGGRSDDTPLGDLFIINLRTCSRADEQFRHLQNKLAAEKLPGQLKYDELERAQTRLRNSVNDGLLRSTSLVQTTAAQLYGTFQRPSSSTAVAGSVYGQAHLWLRGLVELPTFLRPLLPHANVSEDTLGYLAPTEGAMPSSTAGQPTPTPRIEDATPTPAPAPAPTLVARREASAPDDTSSSSTRFSDALKQEAEGLVSAHRRRAPVAGMDPRRGARVGEFRGASLATSVATWETEEETSSMLSAYVSGATLCEASERLVPTLLHYLMAREEDKDDYFIHNNNAPITTGCMTLADHDHSSNAIDDPVHIPYSRARVFISVDTLKSPAEELEQSVQPQTDSFCSHRLLKVLLGKRDYTRPNSLYTNPSA